MQGSVLAIDRALTPQHQHIIVAEVGGELVLRRLLINPVPALQELRGDETITLLDKSEELPVWGVVAYALTAAQLVNLLIKVLPQVSGSPVAGTACSRRYTGIIQLPDRYHDVFIPKKIHGPAQGWPVNRYHAVSNAVALTLFHMSPGSYRWCL